MSAGKHCKILLIYIKPNKTQKRNLLALHGTKRKKKDLFSLPCSGISVREELDT